MTLSGIVTFVIFVKSLKTFAGALVIPFETLISDIVSLYEELRHDVEAICPAPFSPVPVNVSLPSSVISHLQFPPQLPLSNTAEKA